LSGFSSGEELQMQPGTEADVLVALQKAVQVLQNDVICAAN
jgi:hypothetical protein